MGLLGASSYEGTLAAQVAAIVLGFSGPKIWLDPSDVSTLQQDSAGITPVTAAGDPIGRIMDKSGAANHCIQATAASRPLWQKTLAAFDGTDDSWGSAASIDFTSTDKVTVIAGVRKTSFVAIGIVAELSAVASTNNGAFFLAGPANPGQSEFTYLSRGTANASAVATGQPSPVTAVLTGISDIAAPSTTLRVNGTPVVSGATQGTGNFGNYPLFIGRRNNASLPFNGNLYGLIVIGRLLSAFELSVCERYMAQQAGI